MRTWLLVAAERREFEGFLKRIGGASGMHWPGAKFAAEGQWAGDRWWLVANGPGPGCIHRALASRLGEVSKQLNGIVSTGYCGGLNPDLRVGDIIVTPGSRVESTHPYLRGTVHSMDRVAISAQEKEQLRLATGADVVEMEAAAVEGHALENGLPFSCIRVVSDAASHTLPIDFNRYRLTTGDFSRSRIALAAISRPFTALPQLMGFVRDANRASAALGDFLADCRF